MIEIKKEKKEKKMDKTIYIIFIIAITLFLGKEVLADTNKDCSKYSTKTLSGLNNYVRCKKGLEPLKNNFFKSLKWKGKNSNNFDSNKPCKDYSTKTLTGLAAKLKCMRAKKN